jgi:hypothetical protein
MKTLTISTLLFVIAIVSSSFVISSHIQTEEATASVQNVSSFRAHRQGKHIALSWIVSGNSTAQFNVERSYDGEYYEVIGTMNNSGASSYKFKDENVPPGYLYYRISSFDEDGNEIGKSTVEVIRIVQRK